MLSSAKSLGKTFQELAARKDFTVLWEKKAKRQVLALMGCLECPLYIIGFRHQSVQGAELKGIKYEPLFDFFKGKAG